MIPKQKPPSATNTERGDKGGLILENVQLQLQTGFIDRLADNDIIPQRVTDGYINAAAMCKVSGKLMGDYLRLSCYENLFR